MERIGILVDDGVVKNVIVWSDQSYDQYKNDFEFVCETTDWVDSPRIGWIWNGGFSFEPPVDDGHVS